MLWLWLFRERAVSNAQLLLLPKMSSLFFRWPVTTHYLLNHLILCTIFQELIRRLHSLSSAKDSSSSQALTRENSNPSKEEVFQDRPKQSHSSIRKAFQPCFWLFQTFGLKSQNPPLKLLFLTALIILICYFTRKKHATIQR